MKNLFSNIDTRLSARAYKSLKLIEQSPQAPLPKALGNYANLEGFYRLIKNKRLNSESIMNEMAFANINELKDIDGELVTIHDTTFINPKCNMKSKAIGSRGLGTHVSLLASAGSCAAVYGISHVSFFQRDNEGRKLSEELESQRWLESLKSCEDKYQGRCNSVHLMDREGDIFPVLCDMNLKMWRYVIRANHDRCLEEGADEKLFSLMRSFKSQLNLSANLSKREEKSIPDGKNIHPPRQSRVAKLSASAHTTVIKSNRHLKEGGIEECEVNIVRVWESNPPEGVAGVEWFLLTSEPINTPDQIKRVIDLYRRRWLIEEFFKGLKTGCKLEEKQFLDVESWKRLILFYSSIAAKILNLRVIDQANLNSLKFSLKDEELKVLGLLSKKELKTPSDIIYALAAQGGHIKYNGPPGWITLLRGFEKLHYLTIGYSLRCD